MKNSILVTLIIAVALSLTACPEPEPEHTHEYDATWTYDATQHWRECTAHDGAKTDEAAHTAGNWIIDTPATATTAGSRHKECTVCGYVTETEAIPATHIHTYANTWSKDAAQHWHECSCGDKTDVADHEWEWVETTPATPTADGLETETCKTCGAESGNTRIIEQTEPTVKTFTDQVMFVVNTTNFLADIYDARTACGKQNLQQLGIVEKLKDATSGAYTAGGNAAKGRFRNVFNPDVNTKGKVKITIENNVNYESYEVDDSANVRFNIAYLTAVSNDDLQTAITAAVGEMNGKIGQ